MVKFSEKGCEKLPSYSIFILFGTSFSTSVTKLYHTEQRRIYGYSKIFNGAFRDKG